MLNNPVHSVILVNVERWLAITALLSWTRLYRPRYNNLQSTIQGKGEVLPVTWTLLHLHLHIHLPLLLLLHLHSHPLTLLE